MSVEPLRTFFFKCKDNLVSDMVQLKWLILELKPNSVDICTPHLRSRKAQKQILLPAPHLRTKGGIPLAICRLYMLPVQRQCLNLVHYTFGQRTRVCKDLSRLFLSISLFWTMSFPILSICISIWCKINLYFALALTVALQAFSI